MAVKLPLGRKPIYLSSSSRSPSSGATLFVNTLKNDSASTVLTIVRVSLVFLCFYFFLIFFLVGSFDSSAQEMGVPSILSTSSSVLGL